MFGLSGRDDVSAAQEFVDGLGVGGFEHLYDESGEVWERFGIVSQPAWIFINDDGSVDSQIGALGEGGIRDAIADLEAS